MMKKIEVDQSRLPWLKVANPTQAFYPMNPRPEEITIECIGWALSMQCRFNGHLNNFYSVAQHSVIVSEIVESGHPFDNKLIFRAFMHDAPEAYVGDIVTPIKKLLPKFYEIEDAVDRAICDKFDMEYNMPPCIKEADIIALITESRDLQDGPALESEFDIKPMDRTIEPLMPQEAYELFMQRFEELTDRMDWDKTREKKRKKV